MNIGVLNILAADDGPGRFIVFIVIAVIIGIIQLARKAKEKADQEQADQEYQRRREAREESEEDQQARQPAPPRRQPAPVRPQPPRPPARIAQRPPALQRTLEVEQPLPLVPASQLGGGVEAEVQRVESHLLAEETQRRRRLGTIRQLKPHVAAAPIQKRQRGRARIRVVLEDRRAALRGIVLSEILGPPKALRRGDEFWDR